MPRLRALDAFRRRIALKLALTLLAFSVVVALAAATYLAGALRELAVDAVENRLVSAARLARDDVRALLRRGAAAAELHQFCVRVATASDARVTVVGTDGRVLAESHRPLADLPRLESHAQRPEVARALAGGQGTGRRHSTTVDQDLLYVALPIEDEARIVGVIRLASPLREVTHAAGRIHRTLLTGGAVAVAVALALGFVVASRLTRPISEMQAIARRMARGDFTAHAPVRSSDEIAQLGAALNAMAARLREKIADLEHEQAKATAILDGMVEGVIAVDRGDHIVLINESARQMFRLGRGRAEGKPILETVRSTDLVELLAECRAAAPGTVSRRELTLASPIPRVLEVHGVALRLADDETGALLALHDVTQLRRLERIRTEFVANVSHELRTPLTAIHGYLETLLGSARDDAEHRQRFLQIIYRHTERLGRLLDDLLDLSNIELGRVALRLAPTNVGDVADAAFTIIKPRAASRGVDLTLEVPGELWVMADRDRLAQIFINLIDNAVKYTNDGGRVTVAAVARERMAEISVSDTGVGIPSTDLPRITERFYRVDRARSRELGGTGLGLAIVKHLVQAHEGTLSIDSAVGIGTTVRFTLQLAAAGLP